jgi:glycosyltransferase involved in cell wall biosynthesis/predicted SAM-dependent methyltransferase
MAVQHWMEERGVDRRKLLLSLFDTRGFGLEVGPSYNPLLPKSMGYNVEIVDHADADALREKYRNDPNADASRIEKVDYVSDGGSLVDLIGQKERYDFIVASHVIEHVTDIIRFLRDCEALLKPDGLLVLAVPDKRYCFDTLRPVSTVGQALDVFREKRSRHSPGAVFDHSSMISRKSGGIVWLEPTLDDLDFIHTLNDARSQFENAETAPHYIDIHRWQFTPSSFRYFVRVLHDIGYVESREVSFHKNDDAPLNRHEFYMTLSKNGPAGDVSLLQLLRDSEREIRQIAVSRDDGIGAAQGRADAVDQPSAAVTWTSAVEQQARHGVVQFDKLDSGGAGAPTEDGSAVERNGGPGEEGAGRAKTKASQGVRPTVVVIIPYYNGSKFIERSAQSVLDQTVKPDEFIVVNDGSTPEETEFLHRTAERFGFRVIDKENGGQGSARNVGVAASRSQFISFLDQDDFYLRTHIATLLDAIPSEDPHLGWVYGDLYEAEESGEIVSTSMVGSLSDHPKTNIFSLLVRDMFVLPSASLISREAFESVGGFDVQFSGYEDDDLFLRMFRRGYTNHFIDSPVTVWCINGGSTSYSIRMSRSRLRYFKKLAAGFPDDLGRPPGRFYLRDLLIPRFHRQFVADLYNAIVCEVPERDERLKPHADELLAILREYGGIVKANKWVPRRLKWRFALQRRILATKSPFLVKAARRLSRFV